MLTHPSRFASYTRFAAAAASLVALVLAGACEKMPLVAPTGTVITILPSATTVPLNGEVEIVATLIEQGSTAPPPTAPGAPTTPPTGTTSTGSAAAGTPVHNGTVVSFTTTIGRIEPAEARTHNGQVRVKFLSGGQSGTAVITAFSGGASARLENLLVGTAAAERVVLFATPQTLGCSGGSAEVSARVENTTGAGVTGVPVNFTTNAGSLSAVTATTDSSGVARTQLTTTRETIVTANVAGRTAEVTVRLNPRTGISIAGPTTSVSAGVPTTFTVNVGAGVNLSNVVVEFGDGRQQSLGSISGSTTVQNTYTQEGTYIIRATAFDPSGCNETVTTSLTILPGQPPAVTITPSNTNPGIGEIITLTANVSGATSTIIRYEWTFGGPGADRPTAVTTGNRTTASWSVAGSKVISVNVVQSTGPAGDGSTVVRVGP